MTGGRVFRALVVVAATGHFSVPRELAVPGGKLPRVLTGKGLRRQDLYLRRIAKHVLLVGGGVSALEIAAGLLDESNPSRVETVDLSYRGQQFVAKWNHPSSQLLASLDRHVQSKRLHLWMSTEVSWINQSHTSLRSTSREKANIFVPARTVIAAIGFNTDTSFFRDVAKLSLRSERSAPPDNDNFITKGNPVLWQVELW